MRGKDIQGVQIEDEIDAKTQTLQSSLKLWIDQVRHQKGKEWVRKQQMGANNSNLEYIMNPHLIGPLMAVFIAMVFVVSLLS